MRRMRVAAISALTTVGVVLLLLHPEILTGGASASWVQGGITGDYLLVHSYALNIIEILAVALAIVASFLGIRRRLKQRSVWKRRYSMKSIEGGKQPNSESEPQNGKF